MPANTWFSAATIPYTNLKFYIVNDILTRNSILFAIHLLSCQLSVWGLLEKTFFYRDFVTVRSVDVSSCYLMIIEDGEDWIDLVQDRDKWRAFFNVVMKDRIQQNAEILWPAKELLAFQLVLCSALLVCLFFVCVFVSSWLIIIII